jgi:S1-C subfamily serine protease
MPDQDQSGFSRVCPACGRRVPRSVATCRCGAELPADTFGVDEAPEPGGAGSAMLMAVMVGVLAVGAAGYWFLLREAPAAPQHAQAGPEEDAPADAPAAARGQSPEARAWDAAANAEPILPEPGTNAPASAQATPPSSAPGAGPSATEDMVDRVMPAVVLIQATGGRGSGFFVRHDTVITNAHVVDNDGYVTLRRSDGSTLNARVETKAPAFDIAILKVAAPSPSQRTIPMGSAKSLKPGQEIIVIGSALGTLENSVSRGIVSGLRNSGGATLVQTDAAANPGNSGGPMLDRHGYAIGITTLGYRNAEGLNFGVAIDHALDILEGRQSPGAGNQRGLSDIQSQSAAAAPESDRRQQQGEEQLRSRIADLAGGASQIDSGWKRFRDQCFKSPIPGRYDREWFALLAPGGMPADANLGCTSFYATMESDVQRFKGLMQRTVTDARRANVLPGTIRDQLRQHRLDFDWER